ncbi:transposase [Escherichia coli]|nr:transposase [Escherichia coli]
MVWQPEFTDKTLSRKTGAVQLMVYSFSFTLHGHTNSYLYCL